MYKAEAARIRITIIITKMPPRFFLSSWSTVSNNSKEAKYRVSLKTLSKRRTRRNRRSIPGNINCNKDGKNASKSTMARGVDAYLMRIEKLLRTIPSSSFFSTHDHSLNAYSVANISVDPISIVRNILRYCSSIEATDSNTIQTIFMRISATTDIENILDTRSSGSVISRML